LKTSRPPPSIAAQRFRLGSKREVPAYIRIGKGFAKAEENVANRCYDFRGRHNERRLSLTDSRTATKDHRYEASLEWSSDYCRARGCRPCFSTAYGPGSVRIHRHRPGRHSSGRVRPLLSALQSAGGVSRAARCGALGNGPYILNAAPTATCGAARGLAAITLKIRHRLIRRRKRGRFARRCSRRRQLIGHGCSISPATRVKKFSGSRRSALYSGIHGGTS
jgi:hypothetical protein